MVEVLLYVHRNCRFIRDGVSYIYIKIQNLAGVAVIYIYDELMLNVLRCQLTY